MFYVNCQKQHLSFAINKITMWTENLSDGVKCVLEFEP